MLASETRTADSALSNPHGSDKLGLAALLEAFANDQWIGEHYTDEQAVEAVMDRFKRLVEAELEMIELTVTETES